MIGDIIAKIRTDKKISKTDLSKKININVGHLTHIEKGERNPSHKTLREICNAFDVPYQQLMYTYDHNLTQDQIDYNAPSHIIYDSIPIFNDIVGFQKCTAEMNSASCVLRVFDDTMEPKFIENSLIYIQFNCPLINKDIGIFRYNGNIIMRKFIIRRNDLVLRADKNGIDDIILTKNSEFDIIAKVLGPVLDK